MTKKVELCVATDPAHETGNTAKAREYAIPVVPEAEFWQGLGLTVSRHEW